MNKLKHKCRFKQHYLLILESFIMCKSSKSKVYMQIVKDIASLLHFKDYVKMRNKRQGMD